MARRAGRRRRRRDGTPPGGRQAAVRGRGTRGARTTCNDAPASPRHVPRAAAREQRGLSPCSLRAFLCVVLRRPRIVVRI